MHTQLTASDIILHHDMYITTYAYSVDSSDIIIHHYTYVHQVTM